MDKSWKIDPEKCTGCRTCEVVCSVQHDGELNLGRSRIKIVKWEEEGLDVPVVCQHCEVPVCAENCPTGALYKDERAGCVLYRKESCIGCKLCFLVCPTGGIGLDPEEGILKCDLCGGDPQCVKFCSPRAIERLSSERATEKQRRKSAKAFAQSLRPGHE
jgi:Fe-S-cluster-containing hydrogenase component 2